jgi:alkanesulfonate monooxygenase SsuD/methylene tetrahydromethanopterin reductase-like flavin-dependent oxidoreductase (luciferase family)
MMPGRFMLRVGTSEALNEHITSHRWPPYAARRAMLSEAIAIIRGLWRGDMFSYRGRYCAVEDARIYTAVPAGAAGRRGPPAHRRRDSRRPHRRR